MLNGKEHQKEVEVSQPIKSGIYKIVNKINGKCYIGSAINTKRRWWRHKTSLIHNKHFNSHLQHAWNKYGRDNFEFILVENVSIDKLLEIEQTYLLDCKNNPDKYYNISYDAESPHRGLTMSEDAKKKISQSMKGRIASDETKIKMSEARKGMIFSIEHRNNIGKSSKSRIPWSKGRTGLKPSWNKGIPWSEESKRKMREAKLGKQSIFKGKIHSIETREKMRQSAINRWKNKKT